MSVTQKQVETFLKKNGFTEKPNSVFTGSSPDGKTQKFSTYSHTNGREWDVSISAMKGGARWSRNAWEEYRFKDLTITRGKLMLKINVLKEQ